MSLLTHTKPISYLKANAAKIAQELKEDGEHYVITQNGEPAMVVQSVHEYEQTQETLAMLKMLAQSEHDIAQGNTIPADDVIAQLRKRHSL
ncbi:type II toxin-antitoxin system Phd/YefM family antitoxin [Paraglaciecola sp. MB-3u-78]|jgi:prevent-host-death family protein|uniref:type II toxin-antitoxin system Phd/YefM family antitoxin n=1 Tax=Paraglaciecola sp. MB-3u-78 TaxID=2058332 RepID=UPI000C333662|nr:type II toxin-antitoxin system Phd/YefM family antitoxin [Paraglaciecola sp. MB-3u-78]PKG99359.1 prevent-host-death protein [Paraglaciecola sp. MB-3u-78]